MKGCIKLCLILFCCLVLMISFVGCGGSDGDKEADCGGTIISNCTDCDIECGPGEIVQCGAYPPGDLDSNLRCCECVPE